LWLASTSRRVHESEATIEELYARYVITNSVLALMGIGAGTALGAALVDQSGGETAPPQT
jgi:hypothetical protein